MYISPFYLIIHRKRFSFDFPLLKLDVDIKKIICIIRVIEKETAPEVVGCRYPDRKGAPSAESLHRYPGPKSSGEAGEEILYQESRTPRVSPLQRNPDDGPGGACRGDVR